MDRAAALVRLNRRVLEQFSARTVAALRAALPMRLALPHLEPFLARNLEKEIRKDAMVIGCARDALAAGQPPGPQAARTLLAAARDVDREFFESVARLPVRFDVPYARLEPLRLRRIERGLALAGRILGAWRAGQRVREVLPRAELAREVRGLLALYCEETAALSDGVRLPALLAPVRAALTDRLLRLMREAGDGVARDIAAQKSR
jgi:hypothetical protein